MKRSGILHAQLAGIIAGLGHGDIVVIGDAGLPVPPNVTTVDLAVTLGTPPFWDVSDAVLGEMIVERALIAAEADAEVKARFASRLATDTISHEQLKSLSAEAVCVVRTGEAVPYTNIALFAGVGF